jgi:arylformamidase
MSDAMFREYDQAALDAQYDNRRKVPDFQVYLDRWADRSAQARESLESRIGVPYGPSPAQTVDIFPGGNRGPAPVHLFIHGGYWTKLSKNEFSFVANAFAPHEAAVVIVDYALIPVVDMDELVRQCRACLAWTWKNAASFGGDRDRIFISGHSAGGHLVAMLLATDWPGFDPALPPDPIRGAAGISGLYDLEPVRLSYLNEELNLSPETACANSPIRRIRKTRCPFLLPVGGLEGREYLRQSTAMVKAWTGQGEAPELVVMDQHHHFSILAQLEDPESDLSRALRGQMGLA